MRWWWPVVLSSTRSPTLLMVIPSMPKTKSDSVGTFELAQATQKTRAPLCPFFHRLTRSRLAGRGLTEAGWLRQPSFQPFLSRHRPGRSWLHAESPRVRITHNKYAIFFMIHSKMKSGLFSKFAGQSAKNETTVAPSHETVITAISP